MTCPYVEAEKKALPGLLEDLGWLIQEDFRSLAYCNGMNFLGPIEEEVDIPSVARMLIRRGRQYLALKAKLQYD